MPSKVEESHHFVLALLLDIYKINSPINSKDDKARTQVKGL